MKSLFTYIKARLEDQVPELETIRMWNDQFAKANDYAYVDSLPATAIGGGTRRPPREKPFKYPACFIEFQVEETISRALKIKDVKLIVRFRFGLESYKFERLETFDFCDRFSAAVQLMAPVAVVDQQVPGMTFTTFQEITTDFDEDYNNVEIPVKEYRTLYRDLGAYVPLTTDGVITAIETPVAAP